MEDSFRLRVDKAFGSLSSSHALWSLTDDEIERKEWNREKDSPEPEPETQPIPFRSNGFFVKEKKPLGFPTELEKDLDDLEDDVLEEEPRSRASSSQPAKPDDYNDVEWEIKSSIGLDCTLDFEEEEDKYDKVAIGKENSGDRLYLKDVNDYETEADACDILPDSFEDVTRDPRANHVTAKIRLKEDAEAAKKIDSLHVSEIYAPAAVNAQINSSEDGNLKSILKRKETQVDHKLQKRVRFDYECKNDSDERYEGVKDTAMETFLSEEANVSNVDYRLPPDYPSGIPDYMRNPSKYTCYTFDSSDLDEESNRQAYMDFLKLLKSRNAQPDDTPVDLPKSVAFVPKRKTVDATTIKNCTESKQNNDGAGKESLHSRGLPVSIAVGDTRDDEVCAMEEDEPEITIRNRSSSQISGRQYRVKAKSDLDDESYV